jgi:hypothetical protein
MNKRILLGPVLITSILFYGVFCFGQQQSSKIAENNPQEVNSVALEKVKKMLPSIKSTSLELKNNIDNLKNAKNNSQVTSSLDRCYSYANAIYNETLSVEKEIKQLVEISGQDKNNIIGQLREIASLLRGNEKNLRKVERKIQQINWDIEDSKRQNYILNKCNRGFIRCKSSKCRSCCRNNCKNDFEEKLCTSNCTAILTICINNQSLDKIQKMRRNLSGK